MVPGLLCTDPGIFSGPKSGRGFRDPWIRHAGMVISSHSSRTRPRYSYGGRAVAVSMRPAPVRFDSITRYRVLITAIRRRDRPRRQVAARTDRKRVARAVDGRMSYCLGERVKDQLLFIIIADDDDDRRRSEADEEKTTDVIQGDRRRRSVLWPVYAREDPRLFCPGWRRRR